MNFDYENMSNEEINELVDALYNGTDDMERSVEEAAAAARIAADRGDAQAQFRYGTFLLIGEGVEKDEAAAGEYWRKSAAQGYGDAANRLGMCALNGLCGEEKNPAKAAEYFRAAVEAGSADAMLNIFFHT